MRAWIEIPFVIFYRLEHLVALFMRAWIEIACRSHIEADRAVALFMRAWIEMIWLNCALLVLQGRPLHEGVD